MREAMEQGALGVGSSLSYAPAFYAKTDELQALVGTAAKYGGGYISHIRHEGDQLTEALEAFEAYRPAVVLLDIGMPGMDGYEVARQMRLRSNGERVPIIALTGLGQESDCSPTREAGFDHHLVKPVDLGALQGQLASLQ